MIFVNEQNIHSLSLNSLDEAVSSLLSQRTDFKKIFNAQALGVYVGAVKALENLGNRKICSVCVALPAAGAATEEFQKVHIGSLNEIQEQFRKVFSPKAHLFFTNSLVASQIAMDFGLEGLINTLNDRSQPLNQLYTFLELKLKVNPDSPFLVVYYDSKKRDVHSLIVKARGGSGDRKISSFKDFAFLIGEDE